MATAEKRVLQALQGLGTATRPQLAAATGLSLVMVNRVMAELCRSGMIKEAGEAASSGGRRAQQYRLRSDGAYHALIRLEREGNILKGLLEELDGTGTPIRTLQGNFAYVDSESFDGWLDTITRKHALRSITLCTPGEPDKKSTIHHLHKRYGCRVQYPSAAAILSERREGETTLYLPEGNDAACAIYRNGKLSESGALALLPLPTDWAGIAHTDRALVEETVARLIQMICCILSPTRLCLHTPEWAPRFTERIRYNADTKLKGLLPPIRFCRLEKEALLVAMRRYAVRL